MRRLWWGLVALGFRLLYNEMAFTYDVVSKVVSMGEWRSWQRAALKHLQLSPDAYVLELAHGTGDLQLDLYAAGVRPVGLDLSQAMGRITRRKLLARRLTPRLIRGKAQALPFRARAFDAVVCTFPTNFVTQPDTLAEVFRILKPGARFVVVLNGVFTQRSTATRALDAAFRATGQGGVNDPEDLDLSRYEALIRRFQLAGFDAQAVTEPCARSVSVLIVATKPPQTT